MKTTSLCFICSCLLFIACSGRNAGPNQPPKSAAFDEIERPPLVTDIASVTTIDNQVVIELAVGHDQGVLAGDLFRVYGKDPSAPIKGMLQVTDVVGDQRTLARQIGLLDRNQPLTIADEVRLVRNLSLADATADLEKTIEAERAAADAEAKSDNQAFNGLRENYQDRLEDLQQRHTRIIADLERQHEQEIVTLRAEEQRERDRLSAVHRAELAAVRTTVADEAATSLRQERRAQELRIQELDAESIRLRDRIATQVEELQSLTQRITTLHEAADVAEGDFQRELNAERETREVLAQRVEELERRVQGRTVTNRTVLTADPNRSETILDRLERVTAERDLAKQRNKDLDEDLIHLQRLLATTQEQLDGLQDQISNLGARADDREALKQRIDDINNEVARLREHSAALELARLQSERAYYDLAARVLQLPREEAATSDLQGHLQRQLEASTANETQP